MPADGTSHSPATFGLAEASDILAPYIAKERQRDQVWADAHARRAAEARGRSSYVGEPPAMRTEAELRDAAEKVLAARQAWTLSPKGRLYACIVELGSVGFHVEANSLRGIFDRCLSEGSADPCAIGAMLAVLAPINLNTAREAIEACAEILLSSKKAAA